MDAAMLWFDNDPQSTLSSKVSRAADYYRAKYGRNPNLCLVHPTMLNGQPQFTGGQLGKVTIQTNHSVLPGHLWIAEDTND